MIFAVTVAVFCLTDDAIGKANDAIEDKDVGVLVGRQLRTRASPRPTTMNLCENSCRYAHLASDGSCADGGPGSEYSSCDFGTDCADCGTRLLTDVYCDNSCTSWDSDGGCDDGGPGTEYSSLCAYGTDCADCGPRLQHSIWESKEFYIGLVMALVVFTLTFRSFATIRSAASALLGKWQADGKRMLLEVCGTMTYAFIYPAVDAVLGVSFLPREQSNGRCQVGQPTGIPVGWDVFDCGPRATPMTLLMLYVQLHLLSGCHCCGSRLPGWALNIIVVLLSMVISYSYVMITVVGWNLNVVPDVTLLYPFALVLALSTAPASDATIDASSPGEQQRSDTSSASEETRGFNKKAKALSQKTPVSPQKMEETALLPHGQPQSDEPEGEGRTFHKILWTCWKHAGVCLDLKNCCKVIACMPTVTGHFAARLSGIDAGIICFIFGAAFWFALIAALYLMLGGMALAITGSGKAMQSMVCTSAYVASLFDSSAKLGAALSCRGLKMNMFLVGFLLLVGMCLVTCMMTMCMRVQTRKRQDNCGTCLLDCCCATWCAPCVQCQILHDDDTEYVEKGTSYLAPGPGWRGCVGASLGNMMNLVKSLASCVAESVSLRASSSLSSTSPAASSPPRNKIVNDDRKQLKDPAPAPPPPPTKLEQQLTAKLARQPTASALAVKPIKTTKSRIKELNDLKADGDIGEDTYRAKKKEIMDAV